MEIILKLIIKILLLYIIIMRAKQILLRKISLNPLNVYDIPGFETATLYVQYANRALRLIYCIAL